jgi:hypothetical protein
MSVDNNYLYTDGAVNYRSFAKIYYPGFDFRGINIVPIGDIGEVIVYISTISGNKKYKMINTTIMFDPITANDIRKESNGEVNCIGIACSKTGLFNIQFMRDI